MRYFFAGLGLLLFGAFSPSEAGFRAAGDIAQAMGWEEGSAEKVALHSAVGAFVAAVSDGDIALGAGAAGLNEALLPYIAAALDEAGLEGVVDKDALLILTSQALGGLIGGSDGAAITGSATENNYLTHRQLAEVEEALEACGSNEACRQRVIDAARQLSMAQDYQLAKAMSQCFGGNSQACSFVDSRDADMASASLESVKEDLRSMYPDWGEDKLESKSQAYLAEYQDSYDRALERVIFGSLDLGGLLTAPLVGGGSGMKSALKRIMNRLKTSSDPKDIKKANEIADVLQKADGLKNKTDDIADDAAKLTDDIAKNTDDAAKLTDDIAENVGDAANKGVNFSVKQLDKKFKHASDFGVNTTKKNPTTLAQYETAIKSHMADPKTVQQGTYGFVKDSKVHFNPTTNNAVVIDKSGNFVTGFKLTPGTPQYNKFINDGLLR